MFRNIVDYSNVDSIIGVMEANSRMAYTLRQKMKNLVSTTVSKDSCNLDFNSDSVCETDSEEVFPVLEEPKEDYKIYLDDYLNFMGNTTEELALILPDVDDYHYDDILFRLHAESLKLIKELMEYKHLYPTEENDANALIAREKEKIELLKELLNMEDEDTVDEPQLNKIVLVPNQNGRILFLDHLESRIPVDYYDEVFELMESIANGTFKRSKNFKKGNNCNTIGGAREVRGSKVRILFRRLDSNTYAVYALFLKKTTKDRGYQKLLITSNLEYLAVEDTIRENIKKPDFMTLNDQLLEELWKKLGHNEGPKIYRKVLN